MFYFTSDLHLGHRNILRLCNRPFSSIEEMDEVLMDNWNQKVHRDDTVYIMGDLMFRNEKPAEWYLDRLKGKKHLFVGNHDGRWMKTVDLNKYFESVSMMGTFSDGQHKITGCHYPMMTWPSVGKNGYMVFGHIHANTDAAYWPLISASTQMLNAGVDINGFAPVSFEEMEVNNELFKASVLQAAVETAD